MRIFLCGVLATLIVGCSCSDDSDGNGNGGDMDAGDEGNGHQGDGGGQDCSEIAAVVRDFQGTHPDFEHEVTGLVTGLVMTTLDGEQKPVFAHGATRTGGIDSTTSFAQWYRDVVGVNMKFNSTIPLSEESPGHFVYDSASFFPIDGMGYGNSGMDGVGASHNFHFTTEIHTSFEYEGGETFTFRGDDDLFLFVDGKMAVDLGGVHGAEMGTVNMDTLGLTVGQRYAMDIFHAERHTSESNFRVETTIECFGPPILL